MTRDELIERVARAIRSGLAKWDKEDNEPPLAWDAMEAQTPHMAEMYRVMAKAALEAIPIEEREEGLLRDNMISELRQAEFRVALRRINERYPPDTIAGRLAADVLAKYPTGFDGVDRENDDEPFPIPEIEGLPHGPSAPKDGQ